MLSFFCSLLQADVGYLQSQITDTAHNFFSDVNACPLSQKACDKLEFYPKRGLNTDEFEKYFSSLFILKLSPHQIGIVTMILI